MLIKCPECELQVSDKAISCPHCGYPMLKKQAESKNRSKKKMRLPNGFGRITKIKNQNLRKPYGAMISVGKDEEGRILSQLLKPVAYFETYNEAYEALVNYNKDPYSIESGIMFIDLYDKWFDKYKDTLTSAASVRTVTSAWNYAKPLYYMQVSNMRTYHLKECIEKADCSPGVKSRMKSVFNLIFDFAVEYEITDRNIARAFSLSATGKEAQNGHIVFTDEEMNILWTNADMNWVDVILVQCYMGWRPQELGNIMLENVDIKNMVITGGMKTDAGKDRPVPVHPKIQNIINKWYDYSSSLESPYLFTCLGETHSASKKLTYDKYKYRFDKIVAELGLNEDHRAHDGRKHFITMCKKYNVDEYAIKYMVGHAINDITEKVYTERDIEWLKEEIKKIEAP